MPLLFLELTLDRSKSCRFKACFGISTYQYTNTYIHIHIYLARIVALGFLIIVIDNLYYQYIVELDVLCSNRRAYLIYVTFDGVLHR